ncbi:MAG TPA: Abi-alpha family protein [Solirubrobacteraceae bacterium]|jgi:hypothetical protein
MTSNRALRPRVGAVDTATELVGGAARIWLQTAVWGTRISLQVSIRLTAAATDRDTAVDLINGAAAGLRGIAREFLGVGDIDERIRRLGLPADVDADEPRSNGRVSERALRARGAQLLRESADVGVTDGAHPAHARILEELAPDEARILRLLVVDGPQPLVDICTVNLVRAGSEPIVANLSMIGAEAGCRHRDRVPAYLVNLQRLGLIERSGRPLKDLSKYQVLEAQPDVLDAIKRASRAKPVHRSVSLTPFGQDFCDVCLPLED